MAIVREAGRTAWGATRLFRKILKGAVIAGVSLVLAYLLVFWGLQAYYGRRAQEQIDAFNSEGADPYMRWTRPKSSEGARRLKAAGILYSPPYGRNSLYEQVEEEQAEEQAARHDAWDRFSDWKGFRLDRGQQTAAAGANYAFNERWVALLEGYLERNKIALELTKEGAEDGRGPFDIVWSEGIRAEVWHLAMLGNAAELLRADAIVKAHGGDMAGALDDVRLMLRLSRTTENDPALISMLAGYARDAKAFGALQGALELGRPDRGALEAIQAELLGRETMNRLYPMLWSEMRYGIEQYDLLRRQLPDTPLRLLAPYDPPLGGAFRFIWLSNADKYAYVSAMRRLVAASRDENWAAKGEDLKWIDRPGVPLLYTDYLAPRINPGGARLRDAEGKAIALVRMARVVIAASIYQVDNGTYPSSLEELVAARPMPEAADPFSGKPLRYERRGEGFIVYSVGPNRVDDGGVFVEDKIESKMRGRPAAGDIVWERGT